MKLDAEDWAMFDSKLENHRQWTDKKFDDVHGRITNHEKDYPHHKLLNGGNGNGYSRGSYPIVQPDTFRAAGAGIWKISGMVLGISVGALGAAAGLIKLMEFLIQR